MSDKRSNEEPRVVHHPDVEAENARILAEANSYQITRDDAWLIAILRRVSKLPGNYVGSRSTAALDAFLQGYTIARHEAALPCGGALLLNFCRWVLQSPGNPTIKGAMSSVDDTDNVSRFFEIFDEYLRTHGLPGGLEQD
jgi:hypothetical protein